MQKNQALPDIRIIKFKGKKNQVIIKAKFSILFHQSKNFTPIRKLSHSLITR